MSEQFVLVLNCGSSSVKFAVIAPSSAATPISGIVEKIGSNHAVMRWQQNKELKHSQHQEKKELGNTSYQAALAEIMKLIQQQSEIFSKIIAVGHRVVHGGEKFKQSAIIDDEVFIAINACKQLAPLHNPANILGIEAAIHCLPKLPQVAVFDTAFHQTMPNYAYLYAIPFSLYQLHGVRRYGFHGISHRYVSQQAAKLLSKPIAETAFISAHLGNGCSASAILAGKSIDTTMGLTPLEGLVMGTRSGDVDPGLHTYLIDLLGYSLEQVINVLNQESGLLGISGLSMDMRSLSQDSEKGDEQAQLAIEIFCYRLAKYIAALAVPLGRIDTLIFTGGIGENSILVRAKTLARLSILGFQCDDQLNANHGQHNQGIITKSDSTIARVIATNEELLIAQDAIRLIEPVL